MEVGGTETPIDSIHARAMINKRGGIGSIRYSPWQGRGTRAVPMEALK